MDAWQETRTVHQATKTYEALKKKGMSKSRAARISNAQAKKS